MSSLDTIYISQSAGWERRTVFVLPSCLCSSSFVIEFREESDQQVQQCLAGGQHPISDGHHSTQLPSGHSSTSDCKPANGITIEKNGCFSRALLRDRDDLSSTENSESTQHKDEGRGRHLTLCVNPCSKHSCSNTLPLQIALPIWVQSLRRTFSFRCSCVKRRV